MRMFHASSMKNKIKVLFMSDWGDTGFGTVGKQLCQRLAEMDIFDVHYLGWHSTPDQIPVAASTKITLHNTQFWNAPDQFGKFSFDPLVERIRPDVVIALGDPWMIDHVDGSKLRDSFVWLAYVPIDRDTICLPWVNVLKKPDCLVLYSEFGRQVVSEQVPFSVVRVILHGVDRSVFKPWYPPGTDEKTPLSKVMRERKRMTLGDAFADKFIVGFVGRNQIRKDIPRMMKAFKAFNCKTWIERQDINVTNPETGEVEKTYNAEEFCRNKQCFRCDVCPAFQQREETQNSIVYLHTTRGDGKDPQDRPGIGWRIDEIAKRLSLEGRVGMTPNLNALHGVPRTALAQIMNCFDVHLFLSHSEGFGLPIAETLACGVPTFVTNYSSMPELVSQGGGAAITVRDYDTFVTWENEWANADIGHAADEVNKVFSDEQYAAEMRDAAVANRYTPDWNEVAHQFRKLIFESVNIKE